MNVIFYTNSSDPKKCGKALNQLTNVIECKKKYDTTITAPVLTTKEFDGWQEANYCYIEDFNRFYALEPITSTLGGLLEIPCHVDVLETYKDYVKSIRTFVERQENVYSPYITDEELPVRVTRTQQAYSIGHLGNPTGRNIAITICGGN